MKRECRSMDLAMVYFFWSGTLGSDLFASTHDSILAIAKKPEMRRVLS